MPPVVVAVSVVDEPAHIVEEEAVTVAVGKLFTVTVVVATEVHADALVTVTI